MSHRSRHIYSPEIIDTLRAYLSTERYKYIYNPKFIFLCGKGFDGSDPEAYEKTNRGFIQSYIHKRSDSVCFVLSEQLWENGLLKEIDLLTFEEFLAELSDYIILFVESMGSACELGAFTFETESFMDKLILVLDKQYEDHDSFINHGPVTKAKKDKATVVYAELDKAILSEHDLRRAIDDMLDKMEAKNAVNKRIINHTGDQVQLNAFVLEIMEIIRLLQPVTLDDLLMVYKEVKGFRNFSFIKKNGHAFNRSIMPSYILKVLQMANLVKQKGDYFRLAPGAEEISFMFSMTPKVIHRCRSKVLARKYKYKGIVSS